MFVNMTNRQGFGIHHYAGKVMYDGEGFVASNQDTLPTDLMEAALLSQNDILANHMNNDSCMNFKSGSDPEPSKRSAPKRAKSNLVAPTVWTKYKGQLSSLMTNLQKTNSRYIRCIKPNKMKKPILMEHLSAIEQLRCAGVVAAVTLSRSAFPNRLENDVVRFKFWQLWDKEKFPLKGTSSMPPAEKLKHDCHAILSCALAPLAENDPKTGKPITIFCVGKTKSYFKMGALEFLESHRAAGLDVHAVQMQRVARHFLAKKRIHGSQKARKQGIVMIQKWARAMVAKLRALKEVKKARKEMEKFEERSRGKRVSGALGS
jgi:myosin-5